MAGALCALPACATLPDLSANECGDGIVDESTEDCDGTGVSAGGRSYDCVACRITCHRILCRPGEVETGCCPKGYGCGEDNVCRQPTGAHTPLGFPIEVQASRVEIADFDGGGRGDVAAFGAELRIFGLSGEGSAGEISTTPLDATGAALGHLTVEGARRTDLALPVDIGLSVLRSQADGRLAPTAYSSQFFTEAARFVALEAIPVAPDAPDELRRKWAGDELLVVTDGGILSADDAAPISIAHAFPPLAMLPAEIPILPRGPASGCDALVLAYEEEAQVIVYTPCDPGGGYAWSAAVQLVDLEGDFTVHGGARVGDTDGDGLLDLLVGATGASDQLLVAKGLPGGGFSEAALFQGPTSPDLPLALGDLDGDGRADFVDAEAAHLSGGGGAYTPVPLDVAGEPPAEARVADLNRDGAADLLLAFASRPALELFTNAGGGAFNRQTIPLDGAAARLTVGDLDGDLVNDVAFAERTVDEAGMAQTLAVIFGRLSGAPEPPTRVGRFVGVDSILGGRDLAPIAQIGDAMTDLVVISGSLGAVRQLAIFPADGQRRIQSPYLFLEQDIESFVLRKTVEHVPLAAAIGGFDGDAHDDIAALTRRDATGEHHLWWLPLTGEAVVEARPPPELLGADFAWDEAILAVVDGDPCSVAARERVAMVVPYADPSKGGDGALFVAELLPDGVPSLTGPAALPGARGALVRAADIDGDGCRDLVVLPGAGANGSPGLEVRWGPGGFEEATQVGGERPAAFACADVAPHAGLELVMLFPGAWGYAYRILPRDFEREELDANDLGGAVDVAAGDLDGDGLADLALLGPEGLTLRRAEARLP